VPHEVFAREEQQLCIVALGLLPPFLEIRAVVDARIYSCRYAALVERVDQLVVDQDVRAERLVLQPLDLLDEFLVVREERRARLELAFH